MSKLTFKPLAGSLDEYEIISFLPFKTINKATISKADISNGDTPTDPQLQSIRIIPYWVEKLGEIGRRGEVIALNYLKTKYKNVSWVADQTKRGYDILADNELFEIKTAGKSSNRFFISHHELIVAYKNKDCHHLMFIKMNRNGAEAEGYIFDDIFEKFSIDINELIKNAVIYKNDFITMTSNTYMIEIDENFIESADIINLSPFCN